MENWKDRAAKDIRSHRVCDEYDGLLSRAKSKVDALALYRRGIDWCLENDSPSIDLLRNYKQECAFSGIFIDRHFDGELLNDNQIYVFHNCTGTIRTGLNVQKRIIPMLYFANGCDMTVEGESPAQVDVPLYLFGKNNVKAESSAEIQPVIYRR